MPSNSAHVLQSPSYYLCYWTSNDFHLAVGKRRLLCGCNVNSGSYTANSYPHRGTKGRIETLPCWLFVLLRNTKITLHFIDSCDFPLPDDAIFVPRNVICPLWFCILDPPSWIRRLRFHYRAYEKMAAFKLFFCSIHIQTTMGDKRSWDSWLNRVLIAAYH